MPGVDGQFSADLLGICCRIRVAQLVDLSLLPNPSL